LAYVRGGRERRFDIGRHFTYAMSATLVRRRPENDAPTPNQADVGRLRGHRGAAGNPFTTRASWSAVHSKPPKPERLRRDRSGVVPQSPRPPSVSQFKNANHCSSAALAPPHLELVHLRIVNSADTPLRAHIHESLTLAADNGASARPQWPALVQGCAVPYDQSSPTPVASYIAGAFTVVDDACECSRVTTRRSPHSRSFLLSSRSENAPPSHPKGPDATAIVHILDAFRPGGRTPPRRLRNEERRFHPGPKARQKLSRRSRIGGRDYGRARKYRDALS